MAEPDPRLYRKLGAHPLRKGGEAGVRFAVWAPNAERVGVAGDFNGWDAGAHPLRLDGTGVWEGFVPGVETGALYKYQIKPRGGGSAFLKSDPFGFRAELRPGTASLVHDLGGYAWGDAEWLERRRTGDALGSPLSIYELHPGSWRRHPDGSWLSYRELAPLLAEYVEQTGFTHVQLLPVMEHPYDPSWGYQVTGYFAPTSRYGEPDDLRFLIDQLHLRDIGVILDWVPAHFPKDDSGLARFDGTPLYEHQDPRRGDHPDWGTHIFDYGRPQVRNFLVANALFWLEEYHADGLRVDAVASMLYLDYSRREGEWLPNPHGGRENLDAIDFLRELNAAVRERVPGALMIAEESTAWPGVTRSPEQGGLGFHLKWNLGWMNDFLRFMAEDPAHRKEHLGLVTFSLTYAFSEGFVLPLSHDEVVHLKRSLLTKMPGQGRERFANLRLTLGFMWCHPGKKLLFMGAELGEPREWSEDRSLEWELLERPLHAGLFSYLCDLNLLYRQEPALWRDDFLPAGFEWIDFQDQESAVVAFVRKGGGCEVVAVVNFGSAPRHVYRLGVPGPGRYREALNSDSERYGGSSPASPGELVANQLPAHGLSHSLELALPPLALLLLKKVG